MMEAEMIIIPFDIELAKKIQAGEHLGKITTRNGANDARIVCWDAKCEHPIVALVKNKTGEESVYMHKNNGCLYGDIDKNYFDLVLQVPEWMRYKGGDVLVTIRGSVLILREFDDKRACCYVGLFDNPFGKLKFGDSEIVCFVDSIRGYASESDKQKLIDALKESTNPLAKKYLKQFFGIGETEEKQECEFEPFEKVVVRFGENEIWKCDLYSHYEDGYNYPFACVGGGYGHCVSYNEKTKHLIGTTDDWGEE